MEYDPNNNYNDPFNDPGNRNYNYNGSFEDGNQKKQGSKAWGCIPLVLSLVILTLFLTVLFIQLNKNLRNNQNDQNAQIETPLPFSSMFPFNTPSASEPVEDEPKLTPNITTRPAPVLDGTPPVISDPANPFPDVFEQSSLGVVGICNYSQTQLRGSGTGFLISSEGYILTNAHVVEDAYRVSIILPSDVEVDAELIGYDKTTDIAVLKYTPDNQASNAALKPLKLGESNDVRVGDFVITIGDPSGRELARTATFGMVSAISRMVNIDGQTNEYIQTDAAMNPGNSGGPLINIKGEVIGVISAKTITASYDEHGNAISAEGLGFAIPIDKAMDIAMKLITEGHVTRPGIGISVVLIEDSDALSQIGLPLKKAVVVHSVTKGGPGDLAGLSENDVIISYDGISAESTDEFVAYVKSKSVGDEIKINYFRDGSYHDTTLTIGDLNLLD